MLGCIFGEENKFLFSQMKTLLQVNICSVSAWFLSIIDLLMQNTQLFEKPECAIIMQRASGHSCVLVWPWQWSVPGLVPRWILLSRVEERDTNTEPEGFSRAGFGFMLQQGCYQCWNSYRSSIPHSALNDGGKVLSHNERRQWWWLSVRGMLDRRWIKKKRNPKILEAEWENEGEEEQWDIKILACPMNTTWSQCFYSPKQCQWFLFCLWDVFISLSLSI